MHPQTDILIIGVGGSGCSAVEALAAADWPERPPLLAIDTETHDVLPGSGVQFIQIGKRYLNGVGTGGDPRMGQRAMEEDLPALRPRLEQARLVLLVTGLGGGVGTGAAPVIMAEARKSGALTLALAMLPFDCEGRRRQDQAAQGLLALQEAADGVVCLPNRRLIDRMADDAPLENLFENAHVFLHDCLQALWRLLSRRGVINVSFADLCALVRAGNGRCLMACAAAKGDDKAEQAVAALLSHPLLDGGAALRGASALILNISGGPDLTLRETRHIVERLGDNGAADAIMMTGMVCDPALSGKIWIMVFIAEGANSAVFGVADRNASAPVSAIRGKVTQLSLFGANATGRFDGVEPTIMDSENLDKPTYIRRGLPIQKVRDTL